MQVHCIPSALGVLLRSFSGCFTRPGFENFVALVAGWVLLPGRHTVSRVIQAARALGEAKHHASLYRFLSQGHWSVDELGRVLLGMLLRHLPREIVAVVDDTLCHKGGPQIFGAGMHHDAGRSTYGRAGRMLKLFSFGHDWVVLSVRVPRPWDPARGWAIPVLFRLYRNPHRCPEQTYRKRTELAATLVSRLASWLPSDRILHVTTDREYACRTVVRALPTDVVLTGPMPLNAALYDLPGPRRPRGRKPLKGRRKASPGWIAARSCGHWERVCPELYGRPVKLDVWTCTCLWYHVAGTHLVRVVVTKDPRGRAAPRAFFCTDPERSVEEILTVFAARWELEVAFRDAKQTLGLEDPQNGWWRRKKGRRADTRRPGPHPRGRRGEKAVLHTVPLAFLAYALVVLWYLRQGCWQDDVARARRAAPWYRHKRAPAYADMLAALRRSLWAERFLKTLPMNGLRRKLEAFVDLAA